MKIELLLLMCWYLHAHAWSPCPPPSDYCDCSSRPNMHVACDNITTIPAGLPLDTTSLDISKSILGPIVFEEEMKYLQKIDLLYLYMSNAGIEYIEANSFINMTSMRTLDLSGNPLDEVFPMSLYGLSNLWSLIMFNCSLVALEVEMFQYVPNLFHLDLHGNKLTKIDFNFELINLRTLLLHENKLSYIRPEAFTGLTSLTHLTLYSNKLTIPSWKWFGGLLLRNGDIELDKQNQYTITEEEITIGQQKSHSNPWTCCRDILMYAAHLKHSNKSSEQLLITCQGRFFPGKSLADFSLEELNVDCNQTLNYSTKAMGMHEAKQTETNLKLNSMENFTNKILDKLLEVKNQHIEVKETKEDNGNFLEQLTNTQIAIAITAFVVVFCVVVVIILHFYNKKQHKKALVAFMQELPLSEDRNDDATTVSTRTFRQNVAVYGSSGTVIDRDNKLQAEIQRQQQENEVETTPSMKRKPPPYSPPKDNNSNSDTKSTPEYVPRSSDSQETDGWEDEGDDVVEFHTPVVYGDEYSEDELFNSETVRK